MGTTQTEGAFLPVYAGTFTEANPVGEGTYVGTCFNKIDFRYETVDETSFNLYVTLDEPKSLLCHDYILFANTEIRHAEVFFHKGTHKLSFTGITDPASQSEISYGGIKAFGFCSGVKDSVISLVKFLEAFIGGTSADPDKAIWGSHVPPYMERRNVEFLAEAMEYELVPREIKKVEVDPDLIQSGDFLAILRLDGLDPIIMYGTGSHIGHSTMALRFDEGLYVVESQDAWYWPTHGLQRTPWADWIRQAEDASFAVSWLPMREEVRASADWDAVRAFFFENEGVPYGYPNFLFGWIDTYSDNLPPLLANQIFAVLFGILEDIVPDTVNLFLNEGLNKRLGTEGLNLTQIAGHLAE